MKKKQKTQKASLPFAPVCCMKLDYDQLVEAINRSNRDLGDVARGTECAVCGGVSFRIDYHSSERTCRGCGCVAPDFGVYIPDFTNYNQSHSLFKRTAAYRRRYHFNERVAQWVCQGPHAPVFVVWAVYAAAVKRGITNPKRIDSQFIKKVCHRIKFDKYAERYV